MEARITLTRTETETLCADHCQYIMPAPNGKKWVASAKSYETVCTLENDEAAVNDGYGKPDQTEAIPVPLPRYSQPIPVPLSADTDTDSPF